MRTVFLDFASLHPSDLNTQHLSDHLDSVEYWAETHGEAIDTRLQEAEVVVVNKIALQKSNLENAPNLKLICLAATGSDNIDLEAARELGIAVANIRDYCTPSVVQHVFALILTLTQKLDNHRHQVRAGKWQAASDFCLLDPCFDELHDKTIGLIGLGALGSGVASVARAFGMRVVAARLPWRVSHSPSGAGQGAPRLPLDELLRQSDIVSLHCPLTNDTHHIIDAQALASMQTHALLINTARGALVDPVALVAALENNQIGGAGIDVLAEEPPRQGDPLIEYLTTRAKVGRGDRENLIITPHMAWGAREARQRALDQILANIQAFTADDSLNRLC